MMPMLFRDTHTILECPGLFKMTNPSKDLFTLDVSTTNCKRPFVDQVIEFTRDKYLDRPIIVFASQEIIQKLFVKAEQDKEI